ncbi:OsmC-like protein [Geobacter argillaceus]|uniref:OsmC-like protein n=1 Tax=Geobacter argillaceus TaxID=345631 RepID=A0A562VF76_9BACT|nr:OsmC-like protein [Geobacter argillaceus]
MGEARGEIELEDNVLVIKRIRVVYHLVTPAADRDKVERAYALHAEHCPVFRSISTAIAITTDLDWGEQG